MMEDRASSEEIVYIIVIGIACIVLLVLWFGV